MAKLHGFGVSCMFVLAGLGSGNASAAAVTEWNVIALNGTAIQPNSTRQSYSLALVHAAINDGIEVGRKIGTIVVIEFAARPVH